MVADGAVVAAGVVAGGAAEAGVLLGAEDDGKGNNGAAGLVDPEGAVAGFELGTLNFGISAVGLLGCADVEGGAKLNEGTVGCGVNSGFLAVAVGADGAAPNDVEVVAGAVVDAGADVTLACCCCFSLIFDIAAASRSCFSHFE